MKAGALFILTVLSIATTNCTNGKAESASKTSESKSKDNQMTASNEPPKETIANNGISGIENYTVPSQTRIGHIHLKVSDLRRSLDFYTGLLGFELTMMYGDQAAFISAGGYHHHIGLNTWQSKGAPKAKDEAVGLYHTAIVYPTRKDLAIIFDRLRKANYPLSGASDHGVSEAIYLDDPDGNGVELYWDRPKEQWPKKDDGSLDMYTRALDLGDLLSEIK